MITDSIEAEKVFRSLDPEPLSIAKVLWAHRTGEEMTLKDFSKLLEISVANLCDIEKGRKFVSPKRAARFAKALQLSEKLFVQIALQDLLRNDGFKDAEIKIIKWPIKKSPSRRSQQLHQKRAHSA